MKSLRHLRIAALVAALAVPTVSLSGCGSVAADIIAARTVIGVIDMAISAVPNFSNAYFTQHPDAAKQAEIQQRIAEAQAAAAAGEALINGGAAINSGDVAQAFGDFEAAYQDAVALAKDLGILTAPAGSRVGVEQIAGRLVVPTADDLLPKGVDLSTVHARSISVRAARARANDVALRSPSAGKPADPPGQVVFTMAEESLIPWDPILLLHPDGRIESSWLPQWLAVPIAMGLATR